MAEWLILITGDPNDIDAVERAFALGDPHVRVDGDDRFLVAADVQDIEPREAAEAAARELVILINGALLLDAGEHQPIRFGGLVTVDEDGHRAYYDSGVVTARARISGKEELVDAEGNIVPAPPSRMPGWLSARSDSRVQAVLRVLGGGDLDWRDLYIVFENVKLDVGTSQVNTWVGKKNATRFTHTANSAKAIGDDARHAETTEDPPANAMALEEARGFVRRLVMSWLDAKVAASSADANTPQRRLTVVPVTVRAPVPDPRRGS